MPLNWRTTLTVWLICLVSVCLVFWETTASLVTAWLSSGTFSHGFFIPPICAYLIWARRHRLATLRALPDGNGLVLLALLGLLWLAGRFVYVLTVQQLAVVAMIPALTCSMSRGTGGAQLHAICNPPKRMLIEQASVQDVRTRLN